MFVFLKRTLTVGVFVTLLGSLDSGVAAQDQGFEARWRSGTATTITGLLTTLVSDDFAGGKSSTHHVIRDERTGQSFQLLFDRAPRGPYSGRRVTVHGRAHGSALYVVAAQTVEPVQASSADLATMTAPPSGDQRTLVLAAEFRDADLACSTDAIEAAMFSDPNGQSVDALYRASSNNRVTFSGQVLGPLLLEASAADTCNLAGWADSLDRQALDRGVDPNAFRHRMYVLPATSCGAAGWATVGAAPSRSWVLSCGTRGVYAHEIGHNLGMDHASTPTSEYGDNTDPMSIATWMLHGVNAPHRHQLGWTDPDAVRVVAESGLFEVAPLAGDPRDATAPSMLLIRKPDTGDYYYVSYRTRITGDEYIDGSYYSRLSIHRYRGDGSSTRTTLVAGLADGEQFVDSINGITVRQITHDATRSVAQVEIASPCLTYAPTIMASPVAQTGAAPATPVFQLTVTNSDSAVCPARTFGLSTRVPAGWGGSLSTSVVTLAPGASTTVAAMLAVPATTQAGSYVSDVVVPSGDAVARTSLTYTVQPPADTIPPSAPARLAVTTNSKRRQVQLSWQASSDNIGVSAYRISRNGVPVAEVQSTGWVDTAWGSGATYTYTVIALDTMRNTSLPSNPVTVTLPSGGGGGKKP